MPFETEDERARIDNGENPTRPGGYAYKYYKSLKLAWKENRRWTTAHNSIKELFDMDDEQTGKFLAALEFYIREVHPYEDEKIKQNGDIQ